MTFWSQLLGGSDPRAQDRYIDDWLKGIEPGIATATGLKVTVDDALTSPGIAAVIQVQSEDLAKCPLELKRRTDAGFEPATEHPLHGLLKHGPAPWLSSFLWRQALVHGVLADGNGYSRVWWTEIGRLDRITLLKRGSTTVRWADDTEPFFDIANGGSIERGLGWQDVIHVPYRASTEQATNGGVLGVSPILQNRETVALMLAAERFAGLFFGNGAKPSIVLEYDKKLPNDEVAARIRAGIERVYSGLGNQWKVAILELGMKMKEMDSDPSKSQLIETRKHGAEQACTMYRTPPHKIGILDKATFSNIEQQSIDYVTGPISALAKAVESAIEVACLTPAEREIYKVEHNLEGLMRGDQLSRYRAYAIGRQWGWLSADDVRVMENRNKLPNGAGESYLVPLNMVPADKQDLGDPDRTSYADFDEVKYLPAPPALVSCNPNEPRTRRSLILNANGRPFRVIN